MTSYKLFKYSFYLKIGCFTWYMFNNFILNDNQIKTLFYECVVLVAICFVCKYNNEIVLYLQMFYNILLLF